MMRRRHNKVLGCFCQRRPAGRAKAGGFTLVELMIAMVILAFGIMATMAMQFNSLAGAMVSRDNSSAADVAQRVMQIMDVESQQWRLTQPISALKPAFASSDPSYLTDASKSFLENAVGSNPAESNWESWASLFKNPVNMRLVPADDARFCVYVRGGAAPQTQGNVLIVHVAVVFPSASQNFPSNECLGVGSIKDQLSPDFQVDDSTSLQMQGYRVQHFGTQIARKDYLDRPI